VPTRLPESFMAHSPWFEHTKSSIWSAAQLSSANPPDSSFAWRRRSKVGWITQNDGSAGDADSM
jgi:hypothetical protein